MNAEQAIQGFEIDNALLAGSGELATIARNNLAVAALRAEAEREKGCEYCKDPRTFEGVGVSTKYDDRPHVYLCGGISKPEENERFRLCPMCGKRLEVKQDG
jgi:hypothetical protein